MRPAPLRYGAEVTVPTAGAVAGRCRAASAAQLPPSGLSGDSPRARDARTLCWHRRTPRSCGMQHRSLYQTQGEVAAALHALSCMHS